jgi:hypothetical protein
MCRLEPGTACRAVVARDTRDQVQVHPLMDGALARRGLISNEHRVGGTGRHSHPERQRRIIKIVAAPPSHHLL